MGQISLSAGVPATVVGLLRELRSARGTGAIQVGGTPGGAVFLIDGRIAYAETPGTRGLGERLVASGRVSAAAWQTAVREGHGARVLVRDGLIGRHELSLRAMAVIGDAVRALLASDAPVHFVPGQRHWLGDVVAHRP